MKPWLVHHDALVAHYRKHLPLDDETPALSRGKVVVLVRYHLTSGTQFSTVGNEVVGVYDTPGGAYAALPVLKASGVPGWRVRETPPVTDGDVDLARWGCQVTPVYSVVMMAADHPGG